MKKIKRLTHSRRNIRHGRVRARVKGTNERPRLVVFRSLHHIEVQLINDISGKTLCAAHSKELKEKQAEDRSAKVAQGYLVGKLLAQKALAQGVHQVVFDRGGYAYHGRVQAVAEGAREGGLEF